MLNKQDFWNGRCFDAWKWMGAHLTGDGVCFTVWAPSASRVALIGECNNWQEEPMTGKDGFFTLTSQTAREGQLYKYRIYGPDGTPKDHCDPYGFGMELRPGNCSVIRSLSHYTFGDANWMRRRQVGYDQPVQIYELHLGSWKTGPRGWYSYDQLARQLIPYLLEHHYTHVEFMPLTEYPYDGSWGYQVTGFFAPTARYGNPEQLMELIDRLHQAGIGVILDFVPVHFAVDDYGLRMLDGTPLYEYPHPDVGENEWGSCNFLWDRGEVRSFLQSAANYWLTVYHLDGLRMDAVSRMLYWQGDESRGENRGAIEFLRQMNTGLKLRHPQVMLIAEDSSAFPGVTHPAAEGGLGFDYKWDLGWMHDTLSFFQTPPAWRPDHYHKLTFSMLYFYQERYLLELSHDENVHGKATILQKMHGDYDGKFPQARALYLYMTMHPGKKLLFMGSEMGQLREWDENREQDWMLLQYPIHDAFLRYMTELGGIYQAHTALHRDYEPGNFRWIDCHQESRCLYVMERLNGNDRLAAVLNLSGEVQEGYTFQTTGSSCRLLLHTDWQRFHGTTPEDDSPFIVTTQNNVVSLTVDLPPFSGMLFQILP